MSPRTTTTVTPASLRERLRAQLADLKMPGALEALDDILRQVDGGQLAAGEAQEALLGAHITLRNARRLQTAMRSARLPAVKTLGDFDVSFQPSVEREELESLHTLRTLIFPSLMVIDEIGYLPITRSGAMLFFQLMSRHYEHASTVLTSNKGFGEWGEICGDEVMAAALVGRLVHHCHIVNIRGNSYRLRQHADVARRLHGSAPAAPLPAPQLDSPRGVKRRTQEATAR